MAGLTGMFCSTDGGGVGFSWDGWGLGLIMAEDRGAVDVFIAGELGGTAFLFLLVSPPKASN